MLVSWQKKQTNKTKQTGIESSLAENGRGKWKRTSRSLATKAEFNRILLQGTKNKNQNKKEKQVCGLAAFYEKRETKDASES